MPELVTLEPEPPMTHIYPLKTTLPKFIRFPKDAAVVAADQLLPSLDFHTSFSCTPLTVERLISVTACPAMT